MKEKGKWIVSGVMLVLLAWRGISGTMTIMGYFLLGVFVLILLFIALLGISSAWYEHKSLSFRKKNEGNYFLIYGTNKRLRKSIELDLKPLLGVRQAAIFVDRNNPSDDKNAIHYSALIRETETLKFPRLVKIVQGSIKAVSFYPEVCKLKNGETDIEFFKKEILIKLNTLNHE